MSFGAVATSYLTVVPHIEHTIYGSAVPAAMTLGTDGTPTIVLASSFVREAPSTNGWRVIGGRLYVPAGLLASLPPTATLFWFHADYYSDPAALSTRTYTESKSVTLTAGWNSCYWDAPYILGAAGTERAWVGYTFGNAQYLYLSGDVSSPIVATDGSAIRFADVGEGYISRAVFALNGTDYESNNPYGIDIIFDEGAG